MTERWLPVPGYEGLYEASSDGRIRSVDRMVRHRGDHFVLRRGKVIAGWKNRNGYSQVSLSRENKRKDALVSRLVCHAFNGPPNVLHREAAHLDGNRQNNRPENLKWVSHTENMSHKPLHGTDGIGERHSQSKLTLSDVRHIIESRERQSALARRFGVSRSTICGIRNGRSWREAVRRAA